MLIANLSSQERQLYGLIGITLSAAFVFGLLGGLISFSWGNAERPDNWQASIVAAPVDTLGDFTAISTQSRWFSEAGPATAEQTAEAARKAIEGQPESLKLIGIVERNSRPYALFIPVNPAPVASGGPKGVLQFAAGETLVGDWIVKEITASTVVVVTDKEGAEQQTRELSLYPTKK
ncbi:MAG: hypothetical protein EOO68_18725 [Moraxellaceae bacterium]|nr:MAG: hypothetical protein EOO68_18725 [Moraxellaceae bacterium]